MHSFVSSSAGSANLFPRRTSHTGSISAYSHRRPSRVSSDHIRHFSTGHGMALAAAATTGANLETDQGDKCKLIQYEDPVLSRTLTVEETFRKMEELVGSEEESKNWKGIVIALVVIVFILSMIVLAIALITPGKEIVDPGDPFTLAHLIDSTLQPQNPIFHFSPDEKSYVALRSNGTENEIVLVDPQSPPPRVLISSTLFNEELTDLQAVELSPDGSYLLLKIQPAEHSYTCYRIWDVASSKFVSDGYFKKEKKLDMVTWLAGNHELMFLGDNSILYKSEPSANPRTISSSPSDGDVLIGLPNTQYKEILHRQHLTWLSTDGTQVVFAKVKSGKDKDDSSPALLSEASLYLADVRSDDTEVQLNFTGVNSTTSYLAGVSWLSKDELMVVWLDATQQQATYFLCNMSTLHCTENFIYNNDELKWIDVYQSPKSYKTDFYTILPDPANKDRLYRHLAAVKLDPSERKDPKIIFLTGYQWSDHKIIGIVEDIILYTSTSANYTHRHLYSYDLMTSQVSCLTCNLDLGTECLYADATLSDAGKWTMLSCLGPDIPSHYVILTEQLTNGTASAKYEQIDTGQYHRISSAMSNMRLPVIEYLTIPLDSGFDASLKLHLPPQLNRSKIYVYGLVIVIPEGFSAQMVTQKYPDSLTTYLSKNQSYIVAYVDIRGSSHHGEKMFQSVYKGLGLKESHDLQQIVEYLTERKDFYRIEESKISMLGYGYGGFVALHTIQKGIVPCTIAVSPITDLNSLDAFSKQRYMGSENLELSSELRYYCRQGEDCTMPQQQNVLLIHGTKDKVVNYTNSMDLMRKLQLAGYEFKQQIYPEIGHDIANTPVQRHYYMAITRYLTQCFNTTTTLAEE